MKNESNKNVSKKEYTNTGNNAYPERDMRLEFCMKFILTFLDTHLVCFLCDFHYFVCKDTKHEILPAKK